MKAFSIASFNESWSWALETPIEEPPEWGKWGDGKTKPEMKEFFE